LIGEKSVVIVRFQVLEGAGEVDKHKVLKLSTNWTAEWMQASDLDGPAHVVHFCEARPDLICEAAFGTGIPDNHRQSVSSKELYCNPYFLMNNNFIK
jgi:hypothetical protein